MITRLRLSATGRNSSSWNAPIGTPVPEIVVTDTAEAYGALARAWRSQFAIPLICVVGSNGKTTTTQMIASILRVALGTEAMLATEGNYNNSVGVPRTLLRLTSDMKAAVVEAGISHPGEMAQLVSWIRPTVVVVTNAQREHQEFWTAWKRALGKTVWLRLRPRRIFRQDTSVVPQFFIQRSVLLRVADVHTAAQHRNRISAC